MNFVSVIVVTYNSASTISGCLKSILAQEPEGQFFDVTVVDNASSDETTRIVSGEFPQVTLIKNGINTGFASTVNQAAAVAKGTYFLLLNPGVIVQESFIKRMLEFVQGNHLAAVVGCNLVDREGKHQPSCWKKPGAMRLFLETFLPYRLSLPLVSDNPVLLAEVKMVTSSCMAIKREVFERLRGFDSGFFMYYEDADFCFRARRAGYKIFFNPGITVFHQSGGSEADPAVLLLLRYKSRELFFRKHFTPLRAMIAQWIIIAGIALRIPICWIAGRLFFNEKLLRLSNYHNFVREEWAWTSE